jgi:hypothetical protein
VAQDRTVEQSQEADGPREVQVPQADLSARLERLPVGHPSSPYLDDSTRKPPLPDLSKYELPLPEEPDWSADDLACVGSDGSWTWKDCHLTPEESRAADQGLAKRHNAEGRDGDGNYGDRGLTPAMRRVEAQLDCGTLVEDTEKFALKEPDRFKEKLAELLRDEPDKTVE